MKKLKTILLTSTIILAVSGAFANKFDPACADRPQFFKVGHFFFPAGEYGIDFVCEQGGSVCTYYQSNPFNPFSFTSCRPGVYSPIY